MSTQKLGRYDLNRVIGKGAMGLVYEGRDPNLDRRVAIKTILVENLSSEAIADYEIRFKTEAKSAARLQHPNIVSVYDSDRDGNIAFLVMEFIQGEDLKHHLDRGVRFQLDQSIAIIRDLLSALDYAHRQNVIHRDVKPANLLLEASGRVKLTDFGVARIQDSNEVTRTQGSIVGTLKYMAPEQVQGHSIDARTDLFAVGVVLYQLLTGRRPFDDENDFAIMHQIIGKNPEPPSSINPQLPKTLDDVLAKALAKSRSDRFATARDFALALQSACRRATDTTIVPPSSVVSSGGASQPGVLGQGTGTGLSSSTSETGASAVSQEVELVYWKDVKDATDAEELEGFLARFPTGIYADLARRRIKKLTGAPSDGTLSGTQSFIPENTQTGLGIGALPLGDGESQTGTYAATQFTSKPAETSSTDVDFDPLATVKMMSDDEDATLHMPVPALAVMTSAPPEAKAPVTVSPAEPTTPTIKLEPQTPSSAPETSVGTDQAKKKSPATWVAIALAALLITGFAVKSLLPSSPAKDQATLPAAASVTDTSTPSRSPSLAASGTTSVPLAVTAASAPGLPASKPTAKTIAADKARAAETAGKSAKPANSPEAKHDTSAINPPPSAPSPAVNQPEATPKAASALAPSQTTLPSPKAACEGKILLSYHNCMLEQCARPGNQKDPACIERMEIEQRSRNRQF